MLVDISIWWFLSWDFYDDIPAWPIVPLLTSIGLSYRLSNSLLLKTRDYCYNADTQRYDTVKTMLCKEHSAKRRQCTQVIGCESLIAFLYYNAMRTTCRVNYIILTCSSKQTNISLDKTLSYNWYIRNINKSGSTKPVYLHTNRIVVHEFLLVINSNSDRILHCFWYITSCRQKSVVLPTPPQFS